MVRVLPAIILPALKIEEVRYQFESARGGSWRPYKRIAKLASPVKFMLLTSDYCILVITI